MAEVTIKVSDYTTEPFGRYETDGEGNGEEFRKKYLLPLLANGDKVVVDLDGVNDGYGSSFIVEAFANLIRKESFKYEDLEERLHFMSENESWVKEIKTYMKAASGKNTGIINTMLNWK